MRHSFFIPLLVVFGFASACERAPKESSPVTAPELDTQPAAEQVAPTGPIQLHEFKLQASQKVMLMGGEMPEVKHVESSILEALRATSSFSPTGKRAAKGSAVLEVGTSDSQVEVILAGSVTTQDSEPQRYMAEVHVTDADIDDRRLKPLLDEAIRLFAKRINAQARVKSATNEQLLEILKGEDVIAAKLVAVQESRDRRLREAIDWVRPLLASPDARLQVASSAMLVSLEDTQSISQVIDIAEQFSRDKNPQLLPMLYIIADIKTDESKTYLNAVAEGHDAPEVRKVAREALERQP